MGRLSLFCLASFAQPAPLKLKLGTLQKPSSAYAGSPTAPTLPLPPPPAAAVLAPAQPTAAPARLPSFLSTCFATVLFTWQVQCY